MPGPLPPKAELDFRSRKILYAVVAEYISSGEPVGSRKLAKRYGIHLSPASIRNVLADLEDLGYLAQPHTSAGRVPTDRGFRIFVDALVQVREVTADDRSVIVARMRDLDPGRDDVVREAVRLLSSLTGAAAVVTSPRPEEERLAELRFIPLGEDRLLAVLVTRSATVQNRVVPLGDALDRSELERVNNYLGEIVPDRTLGEVRQMLLAEMEVEQGNYDRMRLRAMELLRVATRTAPDERNDMMIEGQGRLFDRPEFSDVEKIRGFLRAFEDKQKLVTLLDRTIVAGGIQVLIGSEAELADVQDVSLVSASYRQGGPASGTLGVIGPTRMDYVKVVPLVGFTAQCLSELFDVEARRS